MKNKTLILLLAVISTLSISGCKKDKIQGCTDVNSLTYNSKAEENDGTCSYIEGAFTIVSENCNSVIQGPSSDTYIMIIHGSTVLSIDNFANLFNDVVATRNGLTVTISSKTNITDNFGNHWDLLGGSGTISSDGTTFNYSFQMDDSNYNNNFGYVSCSGSGTK